MGLYSFRLPDIGEGVTEGEIVNWFIKVGDRVKEDDPMVEVMTDKATVSIGAPTTGTIADITVAVGEVANVGDVIVTITVQGAVESSQPPPPSNPAASAVGAIAESVAGANYFAREPAKPTATDKGRPLATPATRKLAKDLGVDLRSVVATGPGGRVTRQDVLGAKPQAKPAAAPEPSGGEETRQPLVGVRRKIAERMSQATHEAAHFTFVEECDATRLVETRAQLAPLAQNHGVQLTYLPFVIKAVTHALAAHPTLNASLDTDRNEIVFKKYMHIGVAAATDAGLVVPVIRDADKMGLFALASEVARLSVGAKQGTLTPDELKGSTFTITSLGKMSGSFATPILNHPEVGILGVHRIKDKPVVREGEVVVGQVMNLSLSFDHRIVDGHVGAAFAYEVIDALENPVRLFADFI